MICFEEVGCGSCLWAGWGDFGMGVGWVMFDVISVVGWGGEVGWMFRLVMFGWVVVVIRCVFVCLSVCLFVLFYFILV